VPAGKPRLSTVPVDKLVEEDRFEVIQARSEAALVVIA
jgi:hypothetical protein